jgi:phosphoribosyl-ATP pyrophosphohydrolase
VILVARKLWLPSVVAMPAAPASRRIIIASPDVLDRLWTIIDSRKGADPGASHSARFLARGTPQVVLIEAMAGNHAGLVAESADVLYHLLITW